MKYIATTEKVWELLKSNTTEITKVIATDGDYKETVIEKNIFMENMEFLMESGCLVNCIGWLMTDHILVKMFQSRNGYLQER